MSKENISEIIGRLTSAQAAAMRTVRPKVGASNAHLAAAGVVFEDTRNLWNAGLMNVYGLEVRLTRLGVRVHKALLAGD